jgi:hypothetical protein
MKNFENRLFRLDMHIYTNFFYSINLSVGKINNAKNIFLIATLSKKARKNLFDFRISPC